MRIIVLGDTHGCYSAIQKVVDANRSADMFIHLGDGERELDDFLSANPNINFYNVKGNCDYASMAEEVLIIGTGEHKILATHGHSFGVKNSLDRLKRLARENSASILLYAHTHARFMDYDDGLYIMNPGSASCPRDGNKPSYGFIDITPQGIVTNICEFAPYN